MLKVTSVYFRVNTFLSSLRRKLLQLLPSQSAEIHSGLISSTLTLVGKEPAEQVSILIAISPKEQASALAALSAVDRQIALAALTQEQELQRYKQTLVDDLILLASKILFSQTLGLTVGLWTPVVLLLASIMSTVLLFSFELRVRVLRMQLREAKERSIGDLHTQKQTVQEQLQHAPSASPDRHSEHNSSALTPSNCLSSPVVRSPSLSSSSEPVDRFEHALFRLLTEMRFISHLQVPLPNKLVKIVAPLFVWTSVLFLLFDFRVAVSLWVVWGLVAVFYFAYLAFWQYNIPERDSHQPPEHCELEVLDVRPTITVAEFKARLADQLGVTDDLEHMSLMYGETELLGANKALSDYVDKSGRTLQLVHKSRLAHP